MFVANALILFVALFAVEGRGEDRLPYFNERARSGTNRQHVLDNSDVSPTNPGSSTKRFKFPLQHPVTGFVSLGDSYSAGIGTPLENNTKEDACRQGVGAYPYLIHTDLINSVISADNNNNITNETTPSFQWLSCTGSTTNDLLESPSGPDNLNSQIGAINTTTTSFPGFATLSIGGNDLGFFNIINACVFRFYGPYSGGCPDAIRRTHDLLSPRSSPSDFDLNLTLVLLEILGKIRWELHPDFFITVTGYTRFFNDETEACDDASFGVWWDSMGGWIEGPKLTRELRGELNELVRGVNDKLRGVVEGVNRMFGVGSDDGDGRKRRRKKVVFVDYDEMFEGHRFCEEGIQEPDYGRNDTWFFLPGGVDASGRNETSMARMMGERPTWVGGGDWEDNTLPDDSPLLDPDTCLPDAEKSGDWGELALCYMAKARQRNPFLVLRNDERMLSPNSMWYVPTYYGKTFHPVSSIVTLQDCGFGY